MKTVNLTLDEELWREARMEAARRDVSVSALMRAALSRLLREGEGTDVEREERERLVDLLDACRIDLDGRPTREGTYADARFH
jgi:post-segregation antitoxin (ccd killing protein)